MKLPMIIVKLLFLGALFLVSNYDLHLTNQDDRAQFFDLYWGWTDTLFEQGFEMTSYMLRSEWLPEMQGAAPKGPPMDGLENS